jgi:hypothetical protein
MLAQPPLAAQAFDQADGKTLVIVRIKTTLVGQRIGGAVMEICSDA